MSKRFSSEFAAKAAVVVGPIALLIYEAAKANRKAAIAIGRPDIAPDPQLVGMVVMLVAFAIVGWYSYQDG